MLILLKYNLQLNPGMYRLHKRKTEHIRIPYLELGFKAIASRSSKGNQSCSNLTTQSSKSFSVFFNMYFYEKKLSLNFTQDTPII